MRRAQKNQLTFSGIWLLVALALLWLVQFALTRPKGPREVPYSELLSELRAGHIESVEITPTDITARLAARAGAPTAAAPAGSTAAPGTTAGRARPSAALAAAAIRTTRLPDIDETALIQELEARGVVIRGQQEHVSAWRGLLFSWGPLLVLFFVYLFIMRRIAQRGGPLSVGRAQPRIYDRNAEQRITFADVAGVDEAEGELMEVVSFLKSPDRYRAIGARIPKGVLLVGSPGTGKTLLARAVAGEANVPFFSLSGSEFVEMFVGVGAARMRSLFDQAKQRAPCIIFIDELDAIGKTRGGVTTIATHDEREQTLNQLLVEMDGFDPGRGVIIMGATNRPEVLDPALLRPGRFDRTVVVDRPTAEGRLAILRVHTRHVKLAGDVNLEEVAQRTVGMVGADLANVVNEAALAAGRRGATEVHARDFEEAVDRIQLGLERRGKVMSDAEKRRVAFHEIGHALVALSMRHADPVHRVSIIPRSIGALGTTLQLPTEDRYLITRDELRDRLCVMLGGRAAEELTFEDVSTGAHNDLERATETARQMVCRFGMSDVLGPVTFGRPAGSRFLQVPVELGDGRNYSEETARLIDAEVRRLVDEAHERARAVLTERRATLDRMAQKLLERETLDRPALDALLAEEHGHAEAPEPAASGGAARR
ncbi:MAG: ATP-dependent zinc metalloprotease FtsH [Gemmatimonadaceae bacterium]|nr:ATP-dependent zinc metalloprotease FtsH [Gemmatimonadaceae bacterium]